MPTDRSCPTSRGLAEGLCNQMAWVSLFPNSAINIYPSNLQFVLFEPNGPHHSVMHMWFYFVNDAADAPVQGEARERVYAEWTNLNAGDEDVCQRLQ